MIRLKPGIRIISLKTDSEVRRRAEVRHRAPGDAGRQYRVKPKWRIVAAERGLDEVAVLVPLFFAATGLHDRCDLLWCQCCVHAFTVTKYPSANFVAASRQAASSTAAQPILARYSP